MVEEEEEEESAAPLASEEGEQEVEEEEEEETASKLAMTMALSSRNSSRRTPTRERRSVTRTHCKIIIKKLKCASEGLWEIYVFIRVRNSTEIGPFG